MQTSVIMNSNNSFSSSSATSSISSGTDSKDVSMCFGESKLYQTQNSLECDYPNLNVSDVSEKDERYWERRRKNNAAAKRSRERRRQHDIAMEQQIQNLKLSNAILRKELFVLKQRLSQSVATIENSEVTSQLIPKHNFFQFDDISSLLSESALKLISPSYLGIANSAEPISISGSLSHSSSNFVEQFCQSENSDPSNFCINPLDLSLKIKSESKTIDISNSLPKSHPRSNSETSNLDQRYWDRRRRNNEAVRKCRQNKRAKMLCNSANNVNKNHIVTNGTVINGHNNDNSNNVDKIQIKTKIESITNELEKLKSQLKNSENILDVRCQGNIKTEETFPNLSQRIRFNETNTGKKTMKWKNKLIEADQAERDIIE